ncbi:MAG TPA: hypothetical protein VKU60_18935 [Chloroflexota bacterium]|nr:hypothetical protein [Chloroflexota bacterium]
MRLLLAAAGLLTASSLLATPGPALAWTWCGDPGHTPGDGCLANIQGDPVDTVSSTCRLSWLRDSKAIFVSTRPVVANAAGIGCGPADAQAGGDCTSMVTTMMRLDLWDNDVAMSREALRCPWFYDQREFVSLSQAAAFVGEGV